MIKIEQIRATGTQGPSITAPRPFAIRSNVVPISTRMSGVTLPSPAQRAQGFALGRKGRQARIRRRLLDGAFFFAAIGTAALLWWSTQ